MANVIFEIVLIIILIVLTGILSMAELAVVSTKKAKLEKLLNEGHKSAQIIIDFAEDPNQFLSTVQIGITLIGILTGAYGGATLAEPLSEVIGPYVPYSGTISILVVVIITTYLTLVIGEIVPKVIALNNPEKVSLKLAKSMSVLSKVCKPISAVLAKSTDFVLWTIGMKSKSESIVTEEEIELLIEEGREDGTIEKEEEDIIKMLDAAIHAPSPKNQQTWHFTVIQNNELINKIADIVTKNHINLAEMAKEEKQRKIMMSLLSYYTCFKNAPVLIIVYSKEYYMIEEKILSDNNASEEVINELRFPNSAAQGIGAAIENFLLAATELGYGTCYMTGPTHSKKEIENLINFEKEEYNLMAMIALGVSEDDVPNSPPRKDLKEVVTFIK